MAPHCPSEKTPSSLGRHSGHFRIGPPTFPPTPSIILGLQGRQTPTASPPVPIHPPSSPLHVLFQPPELPPPRPLPSPPPYRHGRLKASYSVFKIQFRCHLLCQSSTPSNKDESLLPLGSVPPPEDKAPGIFTDILSNSQVRTMYLLATAETPAVN